MSDPAKSNPGTLVHASATATKQNPSTIPEEGVAAYTDSLKASVSGGDSENVNVAQNKVEPAIGAKVYVRGVHGVMVDPTKPITTFDQSTPRKVEWNAWLSMQWKAGKVTTED